MIKSYLFILHCLFVPTLYLNTSSAVANEKELTILSWSEYMSQDMIKAFEKKYKVKVKEIYFESDDARDRILLETKGRGFDLILVNGIVFKNYRRQGWLQPINLKLIANTRHIEKKWIKIFKPAEGYSVPYFWGTLGIAYRQDLVTKPITSWKQLFNPDKKLQGKILMVSSSRDVIGMGLKSLGYSANSNNKKELKEVEALLIKHKPYVARFGYTTLDKTSSLVSGEIIAATIYGGDAINVAEYNQNIKFVLPEEGGQLWVDYFAVSSFSSNVPLAIKFLNFINQPQWAAKNAEELFLATPNYSAKKYISKKHLNNPIIYPSKKLLKRSEMYKDLTVESSRKRASIFIRYTR